MGQSAMIVHSHCYGFLLYIIFCANALKILCKMPFTILKPEFDIERKEWMVVGLLEGCRVIGRL